jgi:hypothetical protein
MNRPRGVAETARNQRRASYSLDRDHFAHFFAIILVADPAVKLPAAIDGTRPAAYHVMEDRFGRA